MKPDEMVKGEMYVVRFKRPWTNSKPKEFTAQYLGYNRMFCEHQFSGRPIYGTMGIVPAWIKSIEHVSSRRTPTYPKPVSE